MKNARTYVVILALFLMQLGMGVYICRSLEAQGILTAEESAVALSDNAVFEERYQHNPLATSFGIQAFYYAGFKLCPGDSIYYARYWKVAFMALMSPLLFLYGRKRLGLSEFSAATAATIAGFLPGWVAFVWLCGVGLDLVAGIAALLLLGTKRTPLVILSGALVGFSPLLYEAGFIFLPVYMLELALFLKEGWGGDGHKERLVAAAGALVVGALVFLSPMIWWVNNPRLYLGGGELVTQLGALFARNWGVFVRDVFLTGERSYYFFSVAPGLSNAWLMAGIACGMAATVRDWRKWWPIYLLGAMSFAINMISGGAPGLRRVLSMLVLFTLGTGALLDWLKGYLEARTKKTLALAATFALAFTLIIGPAWQVKATASAFESREILLPVDSNFQLLANKTMVQTIDYMIVNPAIAATVYTKSMEPTRPLGLLYAIAKRRGLSSAPELKRAMLDFWRKYEPWYRQNRPTTYY